MVCVCSWLQSGVSCCPCVYLSSLKVKIPSCFWLIKLGGVLFMRSGQAEVRYEPAPTSEKIALA